MSTRAVVCCVLGFAPALLLLAQTQTTPAAKTTPASKPASNKDYPEDRRPALFFRETWKNPFDTDNAQEPKLRQDHLTNANLLLTIYGPEAKDIRIVNHKAPIDDPTYVWSGSSPVNWLVTLRHKDSFVDLSSPVAKIRWRIKQAGFHLLRPVVKLSDGTFWAADHAEAYSRDWKEAEFSLADLRWRGLDIGRGVVETIDGELHTTIDLRRVDEIGFTDLMRGSGGGPGGGSRIDWMEVYGTAVPRP